jgi:hypothetical protein
MSQGICFPSGWDGRLDKLGLDLLGIGVSQLGLEKGASRQVLAYLGCCQPYRELIIRRCFTIASA